VILLKPRLELELPTKTYQQGWFTITKYKADNWGNPILATAQTIPWFQNLITNQGLDRIGNAQTYLLACQVGSGSTPPANNNTSLQTFVAGTSTIQDTVNGAQAAPPYYAFARRTFRFAAGTAAGNLSEVGVGWTSTGSNLFSRALIVDGLGNPITITVLSDEVLDVTYELRNYPNATDVNSNITITGAGTFTLITRGFGVTSSTFWSGTPAATLANAGNQGVTNGPLVPIDSTFNPPSSPDTINNGTYTNGTYSRNMSFFFGLNSGNVAGGIRTFRLNFGIGGNISSAYQCQLGAVLTKLNTQTLTMNVTSSWGRL
jgi:hypothetical protein